MLRRNRCGGVVALAGTVGVVVACAFGTAGVAAERSASPIGSGQAEGGPHKGIAGRGAAEIRDGEGVLRAMQERYAKDWYETLTFTQKSTTHKADGTNTSETWYESALLPGKLRIDIGPASEGNGILVADGALTLFKGGQVTETRPFVHMLLVLGFDVYRQAAETTIAQVKGQGFDLSKMCEDIWEGQPVYVVGADRGDLKTKQFWVDKKRLLFVRMIEPDEKEPAKSNDSRFTDYKKLPVGWVAARVEFFVDGKNVFSEEYSEIKTNPKLDAGMFDAKRLKQKQGVAK
jgi:hypothetical protein